MPAITSELKTFFNKRAGFPLGATPIVFVVGLGFVMATAPKLFVNLRNQGIQQVQIRWLVNAAARISEQIERALTATGTIQATPRILQAALLTPPTLVVLSLIRSAITRNLQSTLFMILGFMAGILTIPAFAAMCVAVISTGRFLLRLNTIVTRALRRFFLWIGPAFSVVVKLALAALLLWGLISLVKWILEEGLVGVVAATLFATAILVWLVKAGYLGGANRWLQTIGGWICGVSDAIGRFLAAYVAPVIGWIVSALSISIFVLFLVGTVFGFFLQAGRTLVLPILDAKGVWVDRTKCLNVGIGVGLSVSLLLVGALSNEEFGYFFDSAWSHTPIIEKIPSVVGIFDTILVRSGETVLANAFAAYSCVIDAAMIVFTGALCAISLITSRRGAWETDNKASVASLVLLGLGAALALVLPSLVLAIWLKAQDQ